MKSLRTLCILSFSVCLLFPTISLCLPYKTAMAAPTTVTVRQGSKGDAVKELQYRLKHLGYFHSNVTSYFGPTTTAAVRWFQSAFGMKVDGIVGPATWAMLRKHTQGAKIPSASPSQPQGGGGNIPQSAHNFSQADLNYLAKLVWAEARGEGYEGMVAVAATTLNRLRSPYFPNTIYGIISEPLQFECFGNGAFFNAKPNDQARKAVMAAINGWDPSNGALYFFNPVTAKARWVRTHLTVIKQINKHVFCKKKG